MGEAARQELNGTGVRVTLIEPGMVDTPFFDEQAGRHAGGRRHRPRGAVRVSQPPHVDVNEILIRPTAQRVLGRRDPPGAGWRAARANLRRGLTPARSSGATTEHASATSATSPWADRIRDDGAVTPARFNFTRGRDRAARTPARLALRFCDRDGGVRDLTFGEIPTRRPALGRPPARPRHRAGDRVLVLVGKMLDWLAVHARRPEGRAPSPSPARRCCARKDLAFRPAHSGARALVADRAARPRSRRWLDAPTVVYLDEADLAASPTRRDRGHGRRATRLHPLHVRARRRIRRASCTRIAYTYAKRMQAEHWLDARPGDLVWCTAGTGWAKSIWNVLLGPWSLGLRDRPARRRVRPGERIDLIGDSA